MLIASKYEEMFAPEVKDFAYITDNTYSSSEIQGMERSMLKVLDYSLGSPLALHFLRRYSRAGNVSSMYSLIAGFSSSGCRVVQVTTFYSLIISV